jgi:6-phosphogluconolactonase
MKINNYTNTEQFIDSILIHLKKSSEIAIESKGVFDIVLTGGNTAELVHSKMINLDTNWRRWRFWFGDERCLLESSSDLNSTMAERTLFTKLPIDKKQVFKIPSYLGPRLGALSYQKSISNIDSFDFIFLGLGEDGHIASLFPGFDLGNFPGSASIIPVSDSPKPPLDRISFSMNKINSVKEIVIIAMGEKKKKFLNYLGNNNKYPVSHLDTKKLTVFFLDK